MANPPKSLPNISYKVTYREVTQRDLAIRAWGEGWAENDHDIYEWPNGRMFDSTDKGINGIYGQVMVVVDSIILQNSYPDAPAHLLQQNGFKIRLQQ